MKILVTGSSGMVGTYLCEQLLREGHEVIGIDWKPNEWSRKVDGVTINIDLRDKSCILSVLPSDIDIIVHLAANARVNDLVFNPSLARDNFETLFNMLEYARENGIKRFMFASSREVYGNNSQVIHFEDEFRIKNCESPYAASKISGEAMINSYQQCYGVNFCIFRYSNIYGMYDKSNRVIPLFIGNCRADKDLIIFGKDKILDFIYIADAVRGTVLLLNEFDTVKNEAYNLATGYGVSLLELAKLIKAEMNSGSRICIKSLRTGEIDKGIADISKIKAVVGYTPKILIQEGIKKSIDWYRGNIYE
jgi:UDP-glucose 4-epimerase